MTDGTLDTPTLAVAIDEVNDVLTDNIYANWVGVFRRGELLGFMVSNGVQMEFCPADEPMREWWAQRTEMDDENA